MPRSYAGGCACVWRSRSDSPVTPTAEDMATFRRLHRMGTPFLLPNAWDYASAAALAAAGFAAVATTSLGVAAAAGKADAAGSTRQEIASCPTTRPTQRSSCVKRIDSCLRSAGRLGRLPETAKLHQFTRGLPTPSNGSLWISSSVRLAFASAERHAWTTRGDARLAGSRPWRSHDRPRRSTRPRPAQPPRDGADNSHGQRLCRRCRRSLGAGGQSGSPHRS